MLHLNLVGSLIALASNLFAAVVGPPEHRRLHAAITLLVAVYFTSYLLTLSGIIDNDSRNVLGHAVAPLAWLLVWSAPAIKTTVVYNRTMRAIIDLLGKVKVEGTSEW